MLKDKLERKKLCASALVSDYFGDYCDLTDIKNDIFSCSKFTFDDYHLVGYIPSNFFSGHVISINYENDKATIEKYINSTCYYFLNTYTNNDNRIIEESYDYNGSFSNKKSVFDKNDNINYIYCTSLNHNKDYFSITDEVYIFKNYAISKTVYTDFYNADNNKIVCRFFDNPNYCDFKSKICEKIDYSLDCDIITLNEYNLFVEHNKEEKKYKVYEK